MATERSSGVRRGAIAIGLLVASTGVANTADRRAPSDFTNSSALASATVAPTFERGPCVPLPSDEARVTCGFVEVPERHGEPSGPALRMAVAVVAPAGAPTTGVPLLFLAGGPGFGSVGDVERALGESFGGRTVVLVDYRGVGLSVPSLACPEVDELAVPSLGMNDDDPVFIRREAAAVSACHDRLVADGIDLGAYNYTEIAADLADLRVALGYDEWDVYGISNGGRVALEVVRRHPDGIRSMILDAASPPQGNLPGELWPNAQQAFDVLFDGCDADTACATAFPDLRAIFFGLVSELGLVPVEVIVTGPEGTGDIPVRFTDTIVLNSLRNALYDTSLIPLLPLIISELGAGSGYPEVAQLIVGRSTPQRFSEGMSLSVNCQEEIAFLPDGFFEDQAARFPMLAAVILTNRSMDACRVWDVGRADPTINEPVQSDIPALVLVGEFDPVHPRSSSEQIAAGLSRSTLIEFPGLGHGTIGAHPCPASLIAPFLDDPTAPVDTSCVTEMTAPAWVLP